MKEYTQGEDIIVFYKKEGDEKYSFKIKNNKELTRRLLLSVKKLRVRRDKLEYAAKGIFEKIGNLKKTTLEPMKTNYSNPIIELAEKVQQLFRSNIETRVVSKQGADHCPIIKVEIVLPDGKTYSGCGCNKRIAKQTAAEKALGDL